MSAIELQKNFFNLVFVDYYRQLDLRAALFSLVIKMFAYNYIVLLLIMIILLKSTLRCL